MKNLLIALLLFVPLFSHAQDICHADGNVIIFSNYEGGHLTIDIDVDIPDLKIGICTYHAAEVIFTGTYAGNITQVIYAGFDQTATGCGATVDETNFTGVDPSIVTKYSAITGDIAICNYLGDEMFGSPIVNCMVGAEGCGETASGGGNASPQIVQFFLAEFGAGSILYSHWTDYSCFPTTTFYASDGGNCCYETPVTPPNPIYDEGGTTYNFFDPDTVDLCDSDHITLDISFYPVVWGDPEWSNGDVGYTTTITEPGTYTVTISDYCHYDPFYLTDEIVVLPCNTTIDTTICAGENYTLPDGSIVTTTGSYDVILIAADGSDSLVTTNLTVDPVYSITIDDYICAGDSYLLPDGVLTISAGTYYAYLTTAAGCDSTIITNLTWAFPSAVAVTDSFCAAGSYVLPDGTSTTLPGVYVITLSSSAGCDSTITLTLNYTITPEIFVDTSVCLGENYILPDGTSVNTAGTYPLLISGAGICDTLFTTILSIDTLPIIHLLIDDGVCLGATSVLGAYPLGGEFSGDGVTDSLFDATAAGVGGPHIITYTFTDDNGCTASATDSIYVSEIYIELGDDIYIRLGESAFIDGNMDGLYVSWSPVDFLSCYNCIDTYAYPPQTTTYTATTNDGAGCSGVDSITIFVDTARDETVFIPNTFTPNGDGLNDYFIGYGINVASVSMRIYDRWGELLFDAEDMTVNNMGYGWNGTAKGLAAEEGVYAYIMTFRFLFGTELTRTGNITLIR